MKNCLILITNYYPFYKGEEYIETEIEYLSKKFDEIIVISTMVSKKMIQTRKVPNNVKVIPSEIEHSILEKAKMTITNLNKVYRNKTKKEIIISDSKKSLINKVYCTYFECRSMHIYEKVRKKLDEINFEKFDKIIIYSYWLYVTANIGIKIKNEYFNQNDIKLISRSHRYDLYENEAPLKYLPQREYLLKNINNIYPCSENGVNYLVKSYPKFEKKITVERLGTNTSGGFCKIDNKKLNIVSCSAIRKVKRLDLIIDALKQLEKCNINYKWVHIGNGPEYEKIKKKAKLNLNSSNYEFKGFMSNKDVLKFYEDSNLTLFLNVSESEGVPVSIMEAMSKGIPIIATDVGGTKEIVLNGINGYLLPKDLSASDLENRLKKLVEMDKKNLLRLSKNSYGIWKEKCNAEELYNNFAYKLIEE